MQAIQELAKSRAVKSMKEKLERVTSLDTRESTSKISFATAQYTEVREPYDYDFLQSEKFVVCVFCNIKTEFSSLAVPRPVSNTAARSRVDENEELIESAGNIRIR